MEEQQKRPKEFQRVPLEELHVEVVTEDILTGSVSLLTVAVLWQWLSIKIRSKKTLVVNKIWFLFLLTIHMMQKRNPNPVIFPNPVAKQPTGRRLLCLCYSF